MRLPYFVIARDEEEAKVIKMWLNNKIGDYKLRSMIGKIGKLNKDEKLLVTIVIAGKSFSNIVGSIREKMKSASSIRVTIRLEEDIVRKLDEIAMRKEIPRSEVIRKALEYFLSSYVF